MAGKKAQKSGTATMERSSKSSKGTGKKATKSSKSAATLTHEQIAQRAEVIWQQKGCQPGQDDQNWSEAEAQLKTELGIA